MKFSMVCDRLWIQSTLSDAILPRSLKFEETRMKLRVSARYEEGLDLVQSVDSWTFTSGPTTLL